MLVPKPCHRGLRPRAALLGLEPLDALMLVPPLYICGVLLKEPLLGVALSGALGALIRLVKWRRLPGYSLALVIYLLMDSHHPVVGEDNTPPYPCGAD